MTRLATAPPRRSPVRMSYERFLRTYMNGERLEWVNGEVVPMPPISGPHSRESNFVVRWVGEWVEENELGEIRTDPFQMKAGPDLPGRAPDLIFVANRNLPRLHDSHLEGPADVAVEIISPSTKTIDRVDKFREYEAGGVREYWIIDPATRQAEFYRLGRDGKYRLVKTDEEEVFRSQALKGFWIKVGWLWSPPTLRDIRREWGIL
jgi:Uma2 family endonuclease